VVYIAAMQTTTIGEVARLGGITARTLHYYDDIGLLTPSERRANGYRGHSAGDITRLQQILAAGSWVSDWTRSGGCSTGARVPRTRCGRHASVSSINEFASSASLQHSTRPSSRKRKERG
jgi:hypothetical protein